MTWLFASTLVFASCASSVCAQSPTKRPTQSTTTPVTPGTTKPQVLFERSTDPVAGLDHGQLLNEVASTSQVATAPAKSTTKVTDAMRAAPVFTAYDFEVHLAPARASLAVEARITLRNGGAEALSLLPLQLSSTLHMERVSLGGVRLPFTQQPVASDADHTGQLEETAVALPQPLAPGASLVLSVAYSGTIESTSARLDRLGTPSAIAARSDWDRISEEFTGLRGFGDVIWYPVSSVPALLGEGARLFTEIGRQRARNQDASIAIRVTDEFTGPAPTIAVLAGHPTDPGTPQAMPNASFPGVLHVTLAATRLGFEPPSLFVAERIATPSPQKNAATDAVPDSQPLRVYATPAHAGDASSYQAAAVLVEPLVAQWLGTRGQRQLAVLDLPVEGAQPSEQGDALLVSLVTAEPQQIAPLLAQALARAAFHSRQPWLAVGVPAFLGNLYVEQTQGLPAALEQLAAARGALALVEPASPGASSGQPLLEAFDAIYYRSKALYVLSMLRDLVGDRALSAALRAYDPSDDLQTEYFEKLIEQASSSDLRWFFNDWVYHDPGLPDLSIANVFSSRTGQPGSQGDQWLVTVDVANDGYAEADVPVTVHSATTAVTERVRVASRTRVSRRLLIEGEPTSVDVNDGTVPEVQASAHQWLLH